MAEERRCLMKEKQWRFDLACVLPFAHMGSHRTIGGADWGSNCPCQQRHMDNGWERTQGERWCTGVDHHPKSEALYKFISEKDFEDGDMFCFKQGGDGDNGESLMYLMDMYFEKEDEG